MTVEQKAEEYKETVHRWRDARGELVQEEDVKQAFIYGYKKCEKENKDCLDFIWESVGFKKRGFVNSIQIADYIEKLEKENAELKEANQTLSTMKNDMWVELEKKRAESQGITNRLHQLTKAKELLAKWVELFKPKGGNIPPTPIQVKTEQFLKEIENA